MLITRVESPLLIGDLEDDGSSKNICNSYYLTWCNIPGDLHFSSIAVRTQNLTVCKMLSHSLCPSHPRNYDNLLIFQTVSMNLCKSECGAQCINIIFMSQLSQYPWCESCVST